MKEENPWKTLSSTIVHANRWLRLRKDNVIRPDGTAGEYYVVELARSASVLAFNADCEVVLVGLWRYVHGQFAWELPTGGGEPEDATTLERARRELLEEAGLGGNYWVHLGEIENSNGSTTDVASLYATLCLDTTTAVADGYEISRIKWVPFSEVVQMALAGEITEATSVVLILKFALMLRPEEMNPESLRRLFTEKSALRIGTK